MNRSDPDDENQYHFIANGCPLENETVLRMHFEKQSFIGIELESFAFSTEGSAIGIIIFYVF